MAHYNAYHPNLKLLAINNLLPTNYKSIIPASTIATWKSNPNCIKSIIGMDSFVGHDDFMKMVDDLSSRALFFKSVRIFWKVVTTYSTIINSAENKKELFRINKLDICNCIAFVKKSIGLKRACKVFGISTNQFGYWKKSIVGCTHSSLNLCRKTYNHQLLETEIATIKHYFTAKAFLFWPTSSVYYQLLKDKAAFFSISTCYNYLKLLGIKRMLPNHRRKNHKIGLRASAPFELLHMDISIFRTINNSKVYLYVICDNFSRCILGYRVSTKFDVALVLENIREVKQKYILLKNTELIVDNGIENRTHLLNDFLDTVQLQKCIAQLHITESNSMVESIFRQLKYYHIYPRNFETATDFMNQIDGIVNSHCNRPLNVLHGLTPFEVLHGKLPDKHLFKDNIAQSRLLRLEANRKTNCRAC
ncbi:MAG: transposase family protein [Flavobacteriales bacterium]|nr:MAG: transposase family protein [Flavobacteriales bacterium]